MRPNIHLYGRRREITEDFIAGMFVGGSVAVIAIVLINVVIRLIL